jgi:hypothetical protein
MTDDYTDGFRETSTKSWFARLGEAFVGILIGIVCFLASFPLLLWNEGRAVRTYLALQEGQSAVLEIPSDRVDSAHEGKLVHVTGQATTTDLLRDDDFGIEINALRLKRVVEIYQWKETSTSRTEKQVGGGEKTITEYSYSKVWSSEPIDSSRFKKPSGHTNTGSLIYTARTQTAPKITVGAFTLSPRLAESISRFEPLPAGASISDKASEEVKENWKQAGEWIYRGVDPANPAIGDQRVQFQAVQPTTVSLFSQQKGDSFTPYATQQGQSLERLEIGSHSAQEMFAHAHSENTLLTWGLRVLGVVLMWLGITLVFRPMVVLADVLPFLGGLVQAGVGLVALLIALPLSLVTIAIGWIAFRPVLGIGLLVAAAVLFGGIWMLVRQRQAASPRVAR